MTKLQPGPYQEIKQLKEINAELLEAAKKCAVVLNPLWVKTRGNNDALLTLIHEVEATIAKAERS